MSVWPGMSALTTIISSKIAKSIGVLSSIAYLLPSNVRLSGLAYTTPSYIRTIALSSGLPTGAEFGGTENIFADQDFWMTFFSEKSSHFQAQNFWWPFLVTDQVLQIFRIFTVLNVVYDLFFTRKITISEKNSLMTLFLYFVRTFARVRQHNTTFQNIGGTDAWTVPTSNFGGTVEEIICRPTTEADCPN